MKINKLKQELKNVVEGLRNRRFNLLFIYFLKFMKFKYKKMPLPYHIQLEPTTKCNLNCMTCTRKDLDKNSFNKDLSFENFKKIVDEIPSLMSIKLQGMGEPFLNPNIDKMLDYARGKKIKIGIISNGSFFSEKNIDLILNQLDNLVISLDSPYKEDYEKIRKGASFDKVIANIKKIVELKKKNKSKMTIGLSMVVTKENYKQIPAFAKLSENLGVDSAGIVEVENWLIPCQKYYEENKKFVEESRKISNEIKKLLKDYPKINLLSSEKRKLKCNWPFYFCFITINGDVTPCCIRPFADVFNFGNAFKNDFKEIWNSKKYQDFRDCMIQNKRNGICDNCPN